MPTPSPGTPKRPVAGRRSPVPFVAGPFGESESPVRAKSRGWLRYQGNRHLTGPMHTSQEPRIQLMENTIQFQLEVFVNKRFDPFLKLLGYSTLYRVSPGTIGDAAHGICRQAVAHPRFEKRKVLGRHCCGLWADVRP